jgi:pimeloyl-ACP methyl ester carboxylesterase
MKLNMRTSLLFIILIPAFARSQTLVSYNLITSYSTTQIDSILAANGIPGIILPSTYDVDVYRVVYYTVDADTLPIVASGALFVPKNPQCRVPLMSYQHGSIAVKSQVPSTLNAAEVIIGETSASDGAVVAMPDYLGLGESPGLHPYVHAYTEARATADLLVVAEQICDELGITRNGQLFLFGYSQGGHATMAAHQLIQEQYGSYFSVTASVPMSGPYDLSGVQSQVITTDAAYPNPAYIPFIFLAYNNVYHLYPSISDFFVHPYDSILPPLFDGTHDLDEVNEVMPDTPNRIIVPEILDSFKNDPEYRLYDYLRLNDTYNWNPQSPVRMYYCEGDQDVNYLNALVAYDHFVMNGNTLVSKQSNGANYDHTGCVLPSLLAAKSYFDSLRLDVLKITFELDPATSASASDGSLIAHVSSGFPPYTYQWSNGSTDSVNADIPAGFYSLTVTDATGCQATSSQYLSVQVGVEEFLAQQTGIFPNPSSGVATIQFPLSGDYALEISDVTGRVVLKDRFFGGKYVLLTDEFSEGLYAVTIRPANRSPYVKLLVVARDE